MKRSFLLVFLVFVVLGLVASEGHAVRPTREFVAPHEMGSPGDDDLPDKGGQSPRPGLVIASEGNRQAVSLQHAYVRRTSWGSRFVPYWILRTLRALMRHE